MHQRKEKGERSSQNPVEAVLNLLPVLETADYHYAGNVMDMICEGLNENKDSKVLNGIVDYYITADSHRIIDILVRSKEPHDKHLFDKIFDLMKNEIYRYKAVQLLMNLVYRQPPWLHKIATHRILNLLINLLKNDQYAPTLMCGLLTLTSLLSIIPGQFIPFLNDTFEIFSRIASWGGKKPGKYKCFIVDVHAMHLQTATGSLFQRLYGLFPYNFLVYLRSVYLSNKVTEDNAVVFNKVIKPLVKQVRLHPFLVNATKEQELEPKRFKKMAYHDVVVECASYCVDRPSEPFRNNLTSSNEHNLYSFDSAQLNCCSNQSSCSINYETDFVNESESSRDVIPWATNGISNVSTPQTSNATSPLTLKNETIVKNYNRQVSSEEVPLDIAVEAKPELLKMEADNSLSSLQSLKDIDGSKQSVLENVDILSALEAKEDDVDKEVLELTSKQSITENGVAEPLESGYTPSASVIQNLMEEPVDLLKSTLERTDSLTKSHEEENEEMLNSLQETDSESFKFHYSSHIGICHCPDGILSPYELLTRPKSRSTSCPIVSFKQLQLPTDINNSDETVTGPDSIVACNSNTASASAFMPISNGAEVAFTHKIATYEELVPYLHPVEELRRLAPECFETHISQNSIVNSLSPTGLLDQCVQSANEAAFGHLFSIPITSTTNTDWTHFGGKAPPDEISILRTKILLLQNQLEFERHRKDVHSERNRRILGRVKNFKMEYDQFESLKEKVALLEQENRDLRNQTVKNCKLYQQLEAEIQQQEKTICSKMLKTEKKNTELENAATEYRQLLIQDKEKFNEIHELNKKCQLDITLLKHQLEHANKKMLQCQRIERDSVYLSKQLILLQELVRQYKEKIEMLKETQQSDVGAKLKSDAAMLEIKDLKQKLESKSYQLDSTKGKVASLEQALEDLKTKQKDHMKILETMKLFHKDEIVILNERLEGLKKISIQKDAHILDLYKDMETLLEEKTMLEKRLNGDVNATTASYHLNDSSAHIQSPSNFTNPNSYRKDAS
ncbi:hamartin-like isoform X1 [Argiope bruennichi]|uniref:hamartin-like isoform X1 n=1 Tax=Argiope bruennichi TaxID=94029 RepID=UPI00249568F6|nr:hamartin-like isoform X1 [Argiope bruennichi]